MKQITGLLLVLLLLPTLTACGEQTPTDTATTTATTAAETTTTVTEATTTTATTVTTTTTITTIPTISTTAKITTTLKTTTTSSVTTTAKPTTTRTLDLSKPSTGVTGPKQAAYAQAINLLDESAYSYQSLVDTLKYLGFAEEYATFAADTCGADWNKQAARRAQYHLDGMGYDTKAIIDLLIGEGFTEAQVAYALEANNL